MANDARDLLFREKTNACFLSHVILRHNWGSWYLLLLFTAMGASFLLVFNSHAPADKSSCCGTHQYLEIICTGCQSRLSRAEVSQKVQKTKEIFKNKFIFYKFKRIGVKTFQLSYNSILTNSTVDTIHSPELS